MDDILSSETKRVLSLDEVSCKVGSNVSDLSCSSSIEITEHPRDACVIAHRRVVFTCKAIILSNKNSIIDLLPQFQWYKDKEILSNGVQTELILSDVVEKEAGSYYCIVTHPLRPSISLHSSRVQLTVVNSKCDNDRH